MTKLDAIIGAQPDPSDAADVLAEIEAEEQDHNRSLRLTPSNGNMVIGWMWYDNDPERSIEEKVVLAVERYRAKFGRWPNACYVNQRSINGGFRCSKVDVIGAPNILPHHFWVGVR